MKRSEMQDLMIHYYCEWQTKSPEMSPYDFLDCLLEQMEKSGMLPPEYVKTFEGVCFNEDGSSYYMDPTRKRVNKWEPEDEKI